MSASAPPRRQRVASSLSIRADEVLLLSEAARRLKLGKRGSSRARRLGLKTARFGRCRYVLGSDVLDFFSRLADHQAAGNGGADE